MVGVGAIDRCVGADADARREVQLTRAAVRRIGRFVGRVQLDDGVVLAVIGGRLMPGDALVGGRRPVVAAQLVCFDRIDSAALGRCRGCRATCLARRSDEVAARVVLEVVHIGPRVVGQLIRVDAAVRLTVAIVVVRSMSAFAGR